MSEGLTFEHRIIHTGAPEERVLVVPGDVDGDGVPELVVGSRAPEVRLYLLDRQADGSWREHPMDRGFAALEAGGWLYDLTGNGRLDFVAGDHAGSNQIYWWACPENPASDPWTRRVLFTMPAGKSHDQLVVDLDGDGRPEVYFWNQQAETIFWVRVPDDPRVEPWPGVRPVAEGVDEEGMAVGDVDGDGRLELLAGQSWFRPPGDPADLWERHVFAEGYVTPRLVAADFDGDGRDEIVLAEGDASLRDREYARLVYLDAGDQVEGVWNETLLHDRLLDPHSLGAGDFDGDGRPDIYCGELGLPNGHHPHPPAQRVYYNRGGGSFAGTVIHQDQAGAHEGKVTSLDGRPVIVGKPFRLLRSDAPRPPAVDSIHLWIPQR